MSDDAMKLVVVGAAGRMAFTNYVLQAVTIWYLAKPLGIKLHEATYVGAWLVFAWPERVPAMAHRMS